MPLILEGSAAAAEIRAATAARAAGYTAAAGRSPTLAAVAIETGAPLHFDVKQRAFNELGLLFQPHILKAGSTAADMAQIIQRLNGDSGVDGIFIQYPLP